MAFEVRITGQTIRRILLGLLIGAALGAIVWLLLALVAPGDPFAGVVDQGRYQAVFLDDGRVYFGDLTEANHDFYELRNAFYIQEVPGATEDDPPTQQVRPLSSEFHDPEDRMLISRDDVVLVENLRADSEVAAAIDRVLGQG